MSRARMHKAVLLLISILLGVGMLVGVTWLTGAAGSSSADQIGVMPLATPGPNTLSVSQVGYRPRDAKRGILLVTDTSPITTFNVLADGQVVVFTGTLQIWETTWGLTATLADFSPVTMPDYYYLRAGPLTSAHFYIDPKAYRLLDPPDEIIPGAVFPDAIFDSFFAYQRSTEPDLNLPVYTRMVTGEVPTSMTWPDASGGWNDAASHDKETVSIAWTTQLLALALERNEAYFDVHLQTRQKILAEIQWGADWLLKMQDVDGGMLLAVKPPEDDLPRRVLGNKGTGVTAKTAAAFATAARVLANENPITYTTYLSAAETAWEWVQSQPNQFIPTTVYSSYWTGKSPSKIWATVELYYTFITTDPVKARDYLTQAISYTLDGTFVDCAWRDDSVGQTIDFRNAIIEEQTIVALARLYQAPDATSDVKNHISDELRGWYQTCVTPEISTPYGIADGELLTPWLGLNGWALQLGMDLLVAGEALHDEDMIRTGQDHIQWVVGNNPFTTSYVVGVGEHYPTEVWYKRPLTASIGAVLPGIFDEEPDGIPDNEVTHPITEGWKLAEPVVWYTAAFLYDMAWLDSYTPPFRIYLPVINKCWQDHGLMCDGGFECPGFWWPCWYEWGWGNGSYTRDSDAPACARGCSQEGLLLQRSSPTEWSGDVVMQEIEFGSGDALRFCSWMRIPVSLPHGETYLEIVFKDDSDSELDRVTGTEYDGATEWTPVCVEGTAPAGTAKAQVYFVSISWPGTDTNQVCYDDAWANMVNAE